MSEPDRIFLSAPDMTSLERQALLDAFDGGWVAPVGPELDLFEHDMADYTGAEACVGLASGTAALHLALLLSGVGPGDEVVVQSATFAASAFAVRHAGAVPTFIDSEASSWCLDPQLLQVFLESRADAGRLPAAVMPVDLYGGTANYETIVPLCAHYGVALVRDAAEALGSVSTSGPVGALDAPAALSFNGNKIITTSSGGALLGSPDLVARAKFLATQAREPELHYEHVETGFNYRLSNLLAALGHAQLTRLEAMVDRRTEITNRYRSELPDLTWCEHRHTPRPNHWLAVAQLPVGIAPHEVCRLLGQAKIEARPGWKPMHQQPVFAANEYVAGDGVADQIFASAVCLPTGSGMTDEHVDRVVHAMRHAIEHLG